MGFNNEKHLYLLDYLRESDWKQMKGKTILITGGTGLIGKSLIRIIKEADIAYSLSLIIIVPTRDINKAKKEFAKYDNLIIIKTDLTKLHTIKEHVDYIIHGAGPTSSCFFHNYPVETIKTFLHGTLSTLELAKANDVLNMVFLSTMEVYGFPQKGKKVTEEQIGCFLPTVCRNSYPLSKVQCENLCYSYFKEYGVNTNIIRLTQTFGPGVEYNDGRVFAEFMRCLVEKKDIVLKTNGETERSYLHVTDAAGAIVTVLLKGIPGEVYTAANENTYCSIRQMAETVTQLSDNAIQVKFSDVSEKNSAYADILYMDLDTTKLNSLGWNPKYDLKDAYIDMISSIKNCADTCKFKQEEDER